MKKEKCEETKKYECAECLNECKTLYFNPVDCSWICWHCHSGGKTSVRDSQKTHYNALQGTKNDL